MPFSPSQALKNPRFSDRPNGTGASGDLSEIRAVQAWGLRSLARELVGWGPPTFKLWSLKPQNDHDLGEKKG